MNICYSLLKWTFFVDIKNGHKGDPTPFQMLTIEPRMVTYFDRVFPICFRTHDAFFVWVLKSKLNHIPLKIQLPEYKNYPGERPAYIN
jgi:hypothetical protein